MFSRLFPRREPLIASSVPENTPRQAPPLHRQILVNQSKGTAFPLMAAGDSAECIQMVSQFRASSFFFPPSSNGEGFWFLPADAFVSRPAFQPKQTDPFILAMFLTCELFVWGPTMTRSYTSPLWRHLALIDTFLEVTQCNVQGGKGGGGVSAVFGMILSCLCNQSLLLS